MTTTRGKLDGRRGWVLRRRVVASYGQDFRAAAVTEKLGLTAVPFDGERYRPPTTEPPRLVVSFNPHNEADAAFIHDLPLAVPVVVHHQLQLSYLDARQRALLAGSVRRAAVTVAPARFLADALQRELAPRQTRCIFNGADATLFRPASVQERQRYRAACHLPPEGLLIVVIGQLSEAKGVQVVERLVSRLPAQVSLVLRSLPPYAEKLAQLQAVCPARICIQVEDHSTRADLPTRYADLVLMLSLSEVAPMVCCEALVAGVPVLSTRCTPFYDELAALGLGAPHLQRLGAPPQAAGRPYHELRYTDAEADALTAVILDAVTARIPSTDAGRLALSRLAQQAGLSQEQMLDGFAFLYAELSAP